jgi:hypothetical protein
MKTKSLNYLKLSVCFILKSIFITTYLLGINTLSYSQPKQPAAKLPPAIKWSVWVNFSGIVYLAKTNNTLMKVPAELSQSFGAFVNAENKRWSAEVGVQRYTYPISVAVIDTYSRFTGTGSSGGASSVVSPFASIYKVPLQIGYKFKFKNPKLFLIPYLSFGAFVSGSKYTNISSKTEGKSYFAINGTTDTLTNYTIVGMERPSRVAACGALGIQLKYNTKKYGFKLFTEYCQSLNKWQTIKAIYNRDSKLYGNFYLKNEYYRTDKVVAFGISIARYIN